MILLILFCYIFAAASCSRTESRLVNIIQGPVRGYKQPDDDIYIFYNIPYATAPTGSQRFKAPLPPPNWTEPYEAVDKEIICPQGNLMGFIHKPKRIQEDCLVASVYAPNTEEKNIPVVVYVHGGAFFTGWGDFAVPKSLVKSKKVIAVTFNYRLGAHGFLCLGTKDIPGNAGMKDQVALLRWVNKNIASFGGNPEEITIAGFSSGASSVDLLMLSKMTDGLFKRVIPESGANIAAFSIQSDPIKNAKEYAMMLNFDKYDNINALQDFYKTIGYEELHSVNVINRRDSTFLLSPCVERNLGEETFLEDNPVNILKKGNFKTVPMLYGFTNMEGLFRVPLFEQWKVLMNEKFSNFLPADLKFNNDTEMEEVAEKVRQFYFGAKYVEDETILGFVNYFADIMFTYPILRSVKFQVEAGNHEIYLYEYSYFDDTTPYIPHTSIRGAAHCAQSFAILDGVASVDENHSKSLRELWLNFMTTGKPVPSGTKLPAWPPVRADWSPHMSLNKTFELKGSLQKERALFWENIYEKYYYNPLTPAP
ncbi:cholinesterase 1-like [Maniola jurtina]|uniref:cholinesterase 1-like n=1 Tax=Maniola jurtina TaxID=191418 RepID=UPI001E689DDC|nr:cholinesterase 1-like [Maniola jurtina]